MTREEVKKLLPIIKAFSEGETIQHLDIINDKWEDVDEFVYHGSVKSYRIKSDSQPKAKYRPFVNAEECWEEMMKHQPFGWIHVTDDNLYHNIIMLAPELGCHEAYIRIGNCTVRGLEETFRIATFADGQPFGVKIEEG